MIYIGAIYFKMYSIMNIMKRLYMTLITEISLPIHPPDIIFQSSSMFFSHYSNDSLHSCREREMKISECISPPGPEGALFQHSVEVPVLRSELFKDLT